MSGFGDIGRLEPRDPEKEQAALLFLGDYAHRTGMDLDECRELVEMLDLEGSFRTMRRTISSA